MGRHSDALAQAQQRFNDLERTIDSRLGAAQGAIMAAESAREARLASALRQARGVAGSGACPAYADWTDPRWRDWRPPAGSAASGATALDATNVSELRIGEIADGVPATLPWDGVPIVLVTADAAAADRARAALRGLAVRAAAAHGQQAALHLIDPVQLGFGFPEREHLGTAAPSTGDAAADLKAVVDAVRVRGVDAPTKHVVVAFDYPRGYGYQGAELLGRLARLGVAGVQLVIHHDLTSDKPGAHDDLDLDAAVVVRVHGDGPASGPWGPFTAQLDAAPPTALVAALARHFQQTSTADDTQPVAWADAHERDPARWWTGDASAFVTATLGRQANGTLLDLTLGHDQDGESRAHVVIGGNSGSGKSVLLRTFVTSLATRYGPDVLRFYLIDGQNGTAFSGYRTLPHADLVALDAPVDLVRSILADLDSELTRRSSLLAKRGVTDITAYQRLGARDMPRLVVVIDEYQRLIERDAREEAIKVLQRIAAQGRKAGVHLVLSSQRFHATGLLNQDALFANIRTRIALSLATDSLDGLDEFGREGRALIRSHCTSVGRAVVNEQGGADGANVAGQVSQLTEDEHAALVADLTALADRRAGGAGSRPVLIDGKEQPDPADNLQLAALARVDAASAQALSRWATSHPSAGGLRAASWHPYDHPLPFIAGRSLSVHGSTVAAVLRKSGENVMLVADDPDVLTGLMLAGLTAIELGVRPGALRVQVLAQLPPPGRWYGALTTRLAGLLGVRGHAIEWATTQAEAEALVADAVAELERRGGLDPVSLADCGPHLVVAAGLERLAVFRQQEGRYELTASPATASLLRLAKDGPALGIHVVLGFTDRAGWDAVLPARSTRHFTHRFVRQLSDADSRALLDSGFGHRVNAALADGDVIGPDRAGYAHRTTGEESIFLPYEADERLDSALAAFVNGGIS